MLRTDGDLPSLGKVQGKLHRVWAKDRNERTRRAGRAQPAVRLAHSPPQFVFAAKAASLVESAETASRSAVPWRRAARKASMIDPVGDVTSWCRSVGLLSQEDADRLAERAGDDLVESVRRVREQIWMVFGALAAGDPPPPEPLGVLLRTAGLVTSAGLLTFKDCRLGELCGRWPEPEAVPAALALLAVEALFVLPKDRLRACPRCGWLFVDRSKGGRRRWCSMTVCGNREKARRHRQGATSSPNE